MMAQGFCEFKTILIIIVRLFLSLLFPFSLFKTVLVRYYRHTKKLLVFNIRNVKFALILSSQLSERLLEAT